MVIHAADDVLDHFESDFNAGMNFTSLAILIPPSIIPRHVPPALSKPRLGLTAHVGVLVDGIKDQTICGRRLDLPDTLEKRQEIICKAASLNSYHYSQ